MGAFTTVTSGILSLDFVLGGGWPKGRVSEIYGLRGSGRSTIALHAVAAAQKAERLTPDGTVLVPRTLLLHNSNADADRQYALRLGADVWPTRFDTRALLGTLCNAFDAPKSVLPELVVVELATEKPSWTSELNQGLARFLRKFCEKPRPTTLLFVTSGDIVPLAYFGSARVQLRTEGEAACGDSVVTAEVVTHRLVPPGKMATLQITPGDGVDLVKDLVRAAAYTGQIENIDASELCATLAVDSAAREDFTRVVRSKLLLTALAPS